MPDDKTRSGDPDRRRINLNEDYEVRDWSKKLGVTADELRAAERAGPMADDVEARLKSRR